MDNTVCETASNKQLHTIINLKRNVQFSTKLLRVLAGNKYKYKKRSRSTRINTTFPLFFLMTQVRLRDIGHGLEVAENGRPYRQARKQNTAKTRPKQN